MDGESLTKEVTLTLRSERQVASNAWDKYSRCQDEQKCWKWEGAWREARDQRGEWRRGGQRKVQGHVGFCRPGQGALAFPSGSERKPLKGFKRKGPSDLHVLKFSVCKFEL